MIVKDILRIVNKFSDKKNDIPFLCRQSNCPILNEKWYEEGKKIHKKRRLLEDIRYITIAKKEIITENKHKLHLKRITKQVNISKYMMENIVLSYL